MCSKTNHKYKYAIVLLSISYTVALIASDSWYAWVCEIPTLVKYYCWMSPLEQKRYNYQYLKKNIDQLKQKITVKRVDICSQCTMDAKDDSKEAKSSFNRLLLLNDQNQTPTITDFYEQTLVKVSPDYRRYRELTQKFAPLKTEKEMQINQEIQLNLILIQIDYLLSIEKQEKNNAYADICKKYDKKVKERTETLKRTGGKRVYFDDCNEHYCEILKIYKTSAERKDHFTFNKECNRNRFNELKKNSL